MGKDVTGISEWFDPPTRLERIVIALLQSDYVKSAFLEASDLCVMARSIELCLEAVSTMTKEQLQDRKPWSES